MNLAKINEVIKASPAIQIESRISLLQRRAARQHHPSSRHLRGGEGNLSPHK